MAEMVAMAGPVVLDQAHLLVAQLPQVLAEDRLEPVWVQLMEFMPEDLSVLTTASFKIFLLQQDRFLQ
jgi:hypothetical protein